METSLKFFVVVLLACSPSESAPAQSGSETFAEVVETPPRIMTVQPLATFNNGKPFVAERDPMTGAFDLRTTPVNADDYIYEEFEDSGESIDRKDDTSHTSNHIISIPAKDSELHKFLNLPVHYSTASKYPLISSSYANTKIQGHGASNHRPAPSTSTPSTVQPSYYPHKTAATTTMKTTTTTTTPRPSTTRPSSTTEAVRTTAKTVASSTSPPPAYEYEYEYDYGEQPNKASSEPPKSDFDFMSFFNFGSSETSTTLRTTAKTTTRPTMPPSPSPSTTRATAIPATQGTFTSSTRLPSTTSQQPKVDNEPKPSVVSSNKTKDSTPGSQGSTMIAFKSENSPSKNKTDETPNSQDQSKDDDKSTEVIGMKPPVKFPDSIMKPPPKYGDRIEPARIEDGGWKGRPDITSGLQSAKIPAKVSSTSYAPPHSNSHVRPFDPNPEGSNQVKYSVNRPHEFSTKKPIEFHQHLVTKFTPTVQEDGEVDDKEPEVKKPVKEEVPPQVVMAISSTPQAATETLPTTVVVPEKTPVPPQTVEPQNRPPMLTFAESESPSRPQQGYGSGQVYHATINDDKPPQFPASTYLQRPPPAYGQPSQPPKDKGPNPTRPEQDNSMVFNKVSYRPKPGLVSSYQPHQHQGLLQGQVQQLHHKPQQGPPQQQGFPQQGPPQPSFTQQGPPQQSFSQQGPSQQNFPQQGSPQSGFQHQGHGQGSPQQGNTQQGLQFHQLPQFHRVPQPFAPPPPQGSGSTGQDEKRPVIWPPKGKPQNSQKVQQFAFFPPPEPRPTGVGTVEPVRPPPRIPNKGAVAVSSVGGDTQSYSLQTSFAIGMPTGQGEESKATAGTVSAVPLHQPVSSVSGSLLPQSSPQQTQPVATNTIKYPPPPWEANLNKPFKDPVKRKPLPNILPQFRPNAKVGTVEPPGPHLMGVNYMREPIDRLQPPPPPPPLPPQPRPAHRSDDHPHTHQHHQHFPPVRPVAAYLRSETPAPPSIAPPQPVHRRNGVGTKVATLQMIQSPPPVTRKVEEPVMVVYPSNMEEASTVKNWRLPTPDFTTDDDFPHDVDDARTKDTPILKEKPSPPKPPLKVEFPYPLERPLPDGEIKEYQAYSPTSPVAEKQAGSSPTEAALAGHRLQDYYPSMSASSSTGSPKRVPPVGQFGWSVIGTRSDDDLTTTTDSGSTSGPMAPPQLTGGFRPIPAPSLE